MSAATGPSTTRLVPPAERPLIEARDLYKRYRLSRQHFFKPAPTVLAVDGVTVATLEAFYKKLWDRAQPDAEISLTVVQGATLRTVVVKPVDRSSTMRKPAGI